MQKMHNPPWALPSHGVWRRRHWLAGMALGPMAPGLWAAEPAPLKVAAAANLQPVLGEIGRAYAQQTGQPVVFNFGASQTLAHQVAQGLPVSLLLSADEVQTAWLVAQGLTEGPAQRYATGRLVALVRHDAPLPLRLALQQGLAPAVDALRAHDKLAIAQPALAPYGQAAREALQSQGLWARAQPHLVMGEHIGQATQFVLSGAAALGLTAAALVRPPEVQARVQTWPVPPSWHTPLHQALVLLKGAGPQARAFRDHLLSPALRPVWQRHGYAVPP